MNNYYNNVEQPVRDERLVLGDSFHGTSCELLDCAREGCIFKQNRSYWEAGACQMSLSLMMAATVENSVIIMHSPIGCGAQLASLAKNVANGKAKRGINSSPMVWLSTNMQKEDIIFGGEKRLRETIRYADREFRPEIIFVISTCAPNIIGDQVEEIITSEAKNVSAELAAIHCAGFKSRVVASAYDAFYHSLIRHIRFEPEPYVDYNPDTMNDPYNGAAYVNYKYKKSRTVNLFNATSINPDDEREIVRLLNALDLNVQIYAEYSNRDKMRLISEAALNVSMCNVHDDYILKYLEEKYHIPYVIKGMPLGKAAIRDWLVTIAGYFGKEEEANKICDYEEKRLEEALKSFIPRLKDKRIVLGGGVVRVIEEAKLLNELGANVLEVRANHYDEGAEPVFREIDSEIPEVPIVVSSLVFELVNQLKQLKPDLVVEHPGKHGWIAKAGFPSVNLFGPKRPYFGYTGEYAFVRSIVFALENPSFSKRLEQHVALPYQESWYKKDPYSYIKKAENKKAE